MNRKLQRKSDLFNTASQGSKSAGSTPISSPVLSRKVNSRLHRNTELESSDGDFIDVENNEPASITSTLISKCPCLQESKVLTIVCVSCKQNFHSNCVNLGSPTPAALKRLSISWKCPDCFIFPYTRRLKEEEKSVALTEFFSNISKISKCNEELKDSATTIEFFNEHIRHLILREDSFNEHSKKTERLVTGIEDISEDIAAIKGVLTKVKESGSALETTSNSLKQEIDDLKDSLKNIPMTEQPPTNSSSFDHVDNLMTEIKAQLEKINDHVCPSASAQNFDGGELPNNSSIIMTPNTTSPHFAAPQISSDPACDPYLSYQEDIVPVDLKNKLIKLLEDSSADFSSVGGSRDVVYFGEHGYWYTGAYHPAKETPLEIQDLLDSVRPCLPNSKSWLNSCLVTRYTGNSSHIPQHCDNEVLIDPESVIVTVSLGQERTIKFTHKSSEKSLELKDGSVYVMSRVSQEIWNHGIEPLSNEEDEKESDDKSAVRYSFTFRHIAPYYKNSTALIGDSNTKYVKFGKDVGTLGKWVPGKRMWAAKIDDIPAPKDIGPYRNIVIHTGINDIRDDFNRPSNRTLISKLKKKCSEIQQYYPNSKVHISLLLPTKSQFVNSRIGEFNSLIVDMVYNRKNMFIIDNSTLGSVNGCMPSKYGRFSRDGTPLVNDVVHLGREGLKVFCINLKRCIVQRGGSQSTERFNGGNGDYRSALGRGSRGDISPI